MLLQILNSISDPIFVKDSQHIWVFLNDAFCDFIGHKRDALIGKTDYDFFPKEEADVFWEKDEQVFLTNQSCENEEFFTDSFGLTHIISTKKTLLIYENGNKFLVATIRDITINIDKYRHSEESLKNAYIQMETLVIERTKQLAEINQVLQAEIAEHQKTELGQRASQQRLLQQKIFDPFFTTKPVGRGTGLGLSIAYQIIIEKHQGKLRCISNPGEGAEFQIEIPVGKAPVYLERARMPIPQEIIPQDMEN